MRFCKKLDLAVIKIAVGNAALDKLKGTLQSLLQTSVFQILFLFFSTHQKMNSERESIRAKKL